MKPRKPQLNTNQRQWVRDWWSALQPRSDDDPPLPASLQRMGRGERAQLRRCADVEALMTHAATLLFAQGLIERNSERNEVPDEAYSYERLAWVAGVLAVVKEDDADGKSLAWRLGHDAGNERLAMSERRFQSMQRNAKPADLFVQWRRAVQLARGKVDVTLLADDLLCWLTELHRVSLRASTGVKFHWACDYYLTEKQRGAAEEPESNASRQEISE